MAAATTLGMNRDGGLRRRRITNGVALALLGACVVVALLPLLSLLFYVVKQGVSSLSVAAFTEAQKPSSEGGGGFLHAILGSGMTLGIAVVIGIPWGVMCGLYLSEIARGRLGAAVRFFLDVLTGVPTIVTGLVVYGLIVIATGSFSALAGGVALALIMVPIVARSAEEMLRLVPDDLREAGLALGMPRWKVTMRIVLPTAAKGVVTGSLLAVARASGETAPLIITTLGSQFVVTSFTGQPVSSLPLYIFQNATQPDPVRIKLAWAAALVLILLILALSLVARLIGRRSHAA